MLAYSFTQLKSGKNYRKRHVTNAGNCQFVYIRQAFLFLANVDIVIGTFSVA